MPNYDYQCPECDHRFEIRQSVGDAPPECSQCGAVTKKVFQVPRIIFKGSGFYVTDKRSESSAAKSEKAATEPAPAETASTESKNEPAKSESPGTDKTVPKAEGVSGAPASQ